MNDLFKKKFFFSLWEVMLVIALLAGLGTWINLRLQEAIAFYRFEMHKKRLVYLVHFFQELAIAHQTDMTLFLVEESSVPKITCSLSCHGQERHFLTSLMKNEIAFTPLFFVGDKKHFSCTFYSSGYILSDSEKIHISDGKRKACIDLCQRFFLRKDQQPIHPFSLKRNSF